MSRFLLSLDQGTTSSRAIAFASDGQIVAQAQQEFPQHFPQPGWVEHQPQEIWQSTLDSAREVIRQLGDDATKVAAIGITNQRETTLLWDRQTGEPVYPAIVWQDRRTADACSGLKRLGKEEWVQKRTGLLLDPYFSATKLAWILDNVDGARQRAERGELAFGTVDTYLLWQLTQGRVHATDATNASRTLLFNIHQQCWDDELLALFNIPAAVLPDVRDSSADFGSASAKWLGQEIPIGAMIGDQQSALVGQACFGSGMAKSTYGTGCFVMMNSGEQALHSEHRLLTTVAYRLQGQVTYALEGSIFMAGATIQWIRDGLQLIARASDTQVLAEQTGYDNPVYMVPAFTGLGAPYWDPDARGAILGLTRDTGIKEIVTAGLQAVCYQTRDLLEAMKADGVNPATLRVDGGMVVNDWLMQFLADVLGVHIQRPAITETTALGAAVLAGLQVGVYRSLDDIQALWQHQHEFHPLLPIRKQQALYEGWLAAVRRVCNSQE
ncbi:glycerol kinase 1 [Bacterioplanes sanyensis]|uniref:glycerol kinase GlpK n=1 Tax=Bacterioplanes sanyensis TaxID=1249553 RepID=UPI00167806CB|nr:glycerol kinase GlpK [Bacterioplanes sanyensis]GGY39866.1 glycerol kinase 1 [Bacterioplanes sanyensis]